MPIPVLLATLLPNPLPDGAYLFISNAVVLSILVFKSHNEHLHKIWFATAAQCNTEGFRKAKPIPRFNNLNKVFISVELPEKPVTQLNDIIIFWQLRRLYHDLNQL